MVRWSDSDISIQFPDVGQVVCGDLFTGLDIHFLTFSGNAVGCHTFGTMEAIAASAAEFCSRTVL